MKTLTPKALAALRWFVDHEPVGWFDASAPTPQMRRKLEALGLIEEAGPRHGARVVKFKLSEDGRSALAHEIGRERTTNG